MNDQILQSRFCFDNTFFNGNVWGVLETYVIETFYVGYLFV